MSKERFGEWPDWPFEPVEILEALARDRVDLVVIGAVAAVLQGSPLPTYSLDVAIAPGKKNRDRLTAALTELDAVSLDDVPDTDGALAEQDLTFYTPYGHLDVYWQPAGFRSYGELRRNSLTVDVGFEVPLRIVTLRGLLRSKLALGDERQVPALEATLELSHLDNAYRPLSPSRVGV